jgi:hypothetical protein
MPIFAEFRHTEKSSLRVTDVMPLDTFGEQAFASALPPAGEDRATTFSPHARTKAVLLFPCSLGWLVSAFHKSGNDSGAIGERLQ